MTCIKLYIRRDRHNLFLRMTMFNVPPKLSQFMFSVQFTKTSIQLL